MSVLADRVRSSVTSMRLLIYNILMAVTAAQKLNFIVVTIGENQLYGYYAAMPYYDVAFDMLTQMYPQTFVNATLDVFYQPGASECDTASEAMYDLTGKIYKRMRKLHGFTVLLSHGCSLEMIALGDFAREVETPLLASLSTDVVFTNRQRFTTFLGFGSTSQGNQAVAIKAFLDYYNWTTVTLFCDTISHYPTLAGFIGTNCRGLRSLLTAGNGYELYIENYDSSVNPDYRARLVRAQQQSRIYLVLTRADQMRQLMIVAYALNMTNNEYVYIHPMCNQGVGYLPLDVETGSRDNDVILDAYKYVIKATFALIDYTSVSNYLHAVSQKANSSYNFSYGYDELHNEIAMAIPEMIFSVGEALNGTKTALDLLTVNDFLNLFVNREFSSGMMRKVTVGSLGLRFVDSVFYKLNSTSRLFEPTWAYDAMQQHINITSVLGTDWDGMTAPPRNMPVCGYRRHSCFVLNRQIQLVIIGSTLGVLLLSVAVIASAIYYTKCVNRSRKITRWLLQPEDIQLLRNQRRMSTNGIHMARYKNQPVWMRTMQIRSTDIQLTSPVRKTLRKLSEMRHRNIGQFYGLLLLEVSAHIVWEGGRETLQSLLFNEMIINDNTVQIFLIFDVIAGLQYIHNRTPLYLHGSLSSQSVIVTSRFVAKINDTASVILSRAITKRDSVFVQMIRRRSSNRIQPGVQPSGSQEADIFALGVILCEILLGHTVIPNNLLPLQIDSIQASELTWQQKIRHLLQSCCSIDPASRPSIAEVVTETGPFQPVGNVVESLLGRLEKHADRLEDLVRNRTQELLAESRKVDGILGEIIPLSLVPALRNKLSVQAEIFDSVTIFFSSMVGFDQFCNASAPMMVCQFLNELYTAVDKQLAALDVYKVETIKDGYVVASGVPVRNGTQHACEIATLALRILDNFATQDQRTCLPIRIGIHSGLVAAGIVGVRMPRYCLFGDTMNTASRMESHGEGSKIHISAETRNTLSPNSQFIFQPRGIINIKGKGPSETFWLLGTVAGTRN